MRADMRSGSALVQAVQAGHGVDRAEDVAMAVQLLHSQHEAPATRHRPAVLGMLPAEPG